MNRPFEVADTASQRTLARTLRMRDVVVIVVGTVIGSGIYIVPATVLRQRAIPGSRWRYGSWPACSRCSVR